MPREPALATLRELARCFQAFEAFSAVHVRSLGLTPPQFDIVATLGNTPGMSFKELGEKTLITKGTLTGVVDRLEARGIVRRVSSSADRRSTRVELTEAGANLFDAVFPGAVSRTKRVFDKLGDAERQTLEAGLRRLREAFASCSTEESA
jgi:MarR family transcriptional regulator, 2-MHQ and catechol-resistance regulon repressor